MASAQLVPDSFHSRYKATRRTYVYKILNRSQPSPFYLNSHYQVGTKLDLEAMNEALPGLLGNHDFSAFRSSSKDDSSSICRVERAELLNLGEAELEFWISANHFVYNMVRIIVGTLIDIGLGKRSRSAIADALVGQRRALTGPTAPAWGLCLHAVEYPAEYGLFQELPV